MNKLIAVLLVFLLVLPLTACASDSDYINADSTSWSSYFDPEISYITLDGDVIILNGDGAVVDGNQLAITSAGIYSISGTLYDGQIIIKTDDQETVNLLLAGVDISCSSSSPIYVKNADKTVITLADGTDNIVTDSDSYTVDGSVIEDSKSIEPNAAIFSKDDLMITGSGSLTVNANYNNGIQSKDDLVIDGGTIIVNAVNDGIKGRDSITIENGNIAINAGGDGIQSNNDQDTEKGHVSIENGTINIDAGNDGIQAETDLLVAGGELTIITSGGSINGNNNNSGNLPGDWDPRGINDTTNDSNSSSGSAKGLKAGTDITVTGGTINIDSADDAMHSNDSLTIDNGNITLTSGDDGIHADATLAINGGEIIITKSYEGLESALVTINDGNIHLISSDDGINVVGGVDGSSINGRPGQNDFNMSTNNHLYINGGYLFINANGDGLDINGAIDMSGGTVIINGPTANNNGALDYYGTFRITGGLLVAVGSSGMAQAPDASSTQYSFRLNLTSSQPADTLLRIESEDGTEILTFLPLKTYQSVVLSSPELQNNTTYNVFSGGQSAGTVTDGLYSGGEYTAGTQITSFTTSDTITSIGSSSGGFPGGGRP